MYQHRLTQQRALHFGLIHNAFPFFHSRKKSVVFGKPIIAYVVKCVLFLLSSNFDFEADNGNVLVWKAFMLYKLPFLSLSANSSAHTHKNPLQDFIHQKSSGRSRAKATSQIRHRINRIRNASHRTSHGRRECDATIWHQ